MTTVNLTETQASAALSALAEAAVSVRQYLSRYETPGQTHDACCTTEATRQTVRAEQREALAQQLDTIENAYEAIEHPTPDPAVALARVEALAAELNRWAEDARRLNHAARARGDQKAMDRLYGRGLAFAQAARAAAAIAGQQ